MKSENQDQAGFALIIVVWGLGILMLIAASFVVTVRTNTKSTANIIENAQAESFADSGISIAIFDLLQIGNPPTGQDRKIDRSGKPFDCRITDKAILRISIEDEGGKVDLNTASDALLRVLFRGVQIPLEETNKLVDRIVDFRDQDSISRLNGSEKPEYETARMQYEPKNSKFESVDELEQVLGITQAQFASIYPLVTVHSSQRGIDLSLAPLRVLKALASSEPRYNTREAEAARGRDSYSIHRDYRSKSNQTKFLIRSEAYLENGGRYVREAIVEIGLGPDAFYQIRSWRRQENRLMATSYKGVHKKKLNTKGIFPDC